MKNKIKVLFEYRMLPELAQEVGVNDPVELLKQMTVLQEAIYYLDTYLETNWKLEAKFLNKHWLAIHQAMKRCGVPKTKISAYSAHVMRYQKHESQLRENKLPTDKSTEYFYYYKSCDVRLMRQIILDHGSLNPEIKMADWRYFDLITELNDDVEDLFEDLETINGNFVLIAAHKLGKRSTDKLVSDFIKSIAAKSLLRKNKFSSKNKLNWIHKETLRQCKLTQALYKKNIKLLSKSDLENAKLFSFL